MGLSFQNNLKTLISTIRAAVKIVSKIQWLIDAKYRLNSSTHNIRMRMNEYCFVALGMSFSEDNRGLIFSIIIV